MKLLCIHWLDSRGVTTSWEDKDELPSLLPAKCKTVGWVTEETKKYITLVQSVGPEEVLGRITIPLKAVVKRKLLK